MALMVLTSNVNGAHDSVKWKDIWSFTPHTDIICFQETHLCSEQEYSFKLYAQSYDYWFSHGKTNSVGVCVCIHRGLGVNTVKVGEVPGHLLALQLQRDGDGLDLMVTCIYAHSDPVLRSGLFNSLHTHFQNKIILLGDFNSVTNQYDRLSGSLDTTSACLDQLLWDHHFHEPAGSHLNTFTYHHPSISSRKSCIDRCYINFESPWKGYAQYAPFSDHYMVGLLVPKPENLGPRPWRFPSDLLQQEHFCLQVGIILECFDQNNPNNSWETIKLRVQERAQQ